MSDEYEQDPPVDPAAQSESTDAPEAPSVDGTPPGASVVERDAPPKRPRPNGGRPKGAKDGEEPPDLDPRAVLQSVPVADAPHPRDPQMGSSLTKAQRQAFRKAVAEGRKRDDEKAAFRAKRAGKKKTAKEKAERAAKRKSPAGAPAWEPSETDKAQVMALAGLGMSKDETCMILGVAWETFSKHPSLDQWRAMGLAVAKSRVRQAGYTQAVSGSLGHWRFFEERVLGYNPRIEHTGANGAPLVPETRPLSDQEILDKLRTLNDKAASITARPISGYTPPHDPEHGARPAEAAPSAAEEPTS